MLSYHEMPKSVGNSNIFASMILGVLINEIVWKSYFKILSKISFTTIGKVANEVQTNELNWYVWPSYKNKIDEIMKVRKTYILKAFPRIFLFDNP